MTDKTWDTEDPGDLPYRFAYSPITGEVFVITLGGFRQAIGISEVFLNRQAFHRFLYEGDKTDRLIADKGLNQEGLKEAENILEDKQKKE